MSKISAIIITYNEEMFIEKCLSSIVDIADEIIVVDSFSTDATEKICKKYNVRFVQHKFEGYKNQKNYALSLASYKNILAVDADETLSDELRKSILAVKENWKYGGYLINRRNLYCGKWIRHSEWYPNRQLRLFYSDKGQFGKFNIHEKFILSNGQPIGKLKGDLIHWSCTTPQDHIAKMHKYALLGAEEYYKAGIKANSLTPFIHFLWGFLRAYIFKGGFLDGNYGLQICLIYAKSTFDKYNRLRYLIKTKYPR